mgnify:CR=1 FL=1
MDRGEGNGAAGEGRAHAEVGGGRVIVAEYSIVFQHQKNVFYFQSNSKSLAFRHRILISLMTSLRLVFLHGFHDRGGGLGELHHDARDVADDFGEVAGGDVVRVAGVDGGSGAVLILDLHTSGFEITEVVRGAPLWAVGKHGGNVLDPVEAGVQGDFHCGVGGGGKVSGMQTERASDGASRPDRRRKQNYVLDVLSPMVHTLAVAPVLSSPIFFWVPSA